MPTIVELARVLSPASVNIRGTAWPVHVLSDLEAERLAACEPRPTGEKATHEAMGAYIARAEAAYAAATIRLSVIEPDSATREYTPGAAMADLKAWRALAVDAIRKTLTSREIRAILTAAEEAVNPAKLQEAAGKDSGSPTTN